MFSALSGKTTDISIVEQEIVEIYYRIKCFETIFTGSTTRNDDSDGMIGKVYGGAGSMSG